MTGFSANTAPSLADRLKGVVVSVRTELDVSRHVFRDGPAYILRDPVSFSTTRFDPGDYRVFNAIRADKTLGEIFDGLVASADLEPEDEQMFYEFVLDLHQRTLLTLPVNNADALFQRYERRQRAEALSKVLGFLFLRIPLVNPDRFLGATMPLARWLFTRPALIAWVLLWIAALTTALFRWGDLTAPAISTLTGENIALLWATLIALKLIHEFGHAYACKALGGHVPEIGVFMILFTPVAYVDATDSWSFPKARHRAIVTLGGMYFESIIGALAIFVWALTDPSPINALAYKVILLSTVVTAAFNLNPLMRYDAYYLVSDLTGIPNLRARAQSAVAALARRRLLGLRIDGDAERVSLGLVSFGIAQMIYKVLILISISMILVLKFGAAGIAMTGVFLLIAACKPLAGLVMYLLKAEEVAPVRGRALAMAGGAVVSLVAVAGAIPLPASIEASGVLTHEYTTSLRAPATAYIRTVSVMPGDPASAGDPLLVLESPDLTAERNQSQAELELALAKLRVAAAGTPGEYTEAATTVRSFEERLESLESDLSDLRVTAPIDARITSVSQARPGTRVKPGDELLRLGAGAIEARFLIPAEERDSIRVELGQRVECRAAAAPGRSLTGTISHLGALGTREIPGTAQIPIDPNTGLAPVPYFEVRVRLDDGASLPTGGGARVMLPAQSRTLARSIERRVSRFFNQVRVADATP